MIELKEGLEVISASRLKSFLSCRAKHYYHYIEELPTATTSALSLGSAAHFAIETGYKAPVNISSFAAVMAFELALCVESVKCGETVRDTQLTRSITRYSFDAEKRPKFVEQEFTIPFPRSNPICYLHGYMDQVYEDGVVDLKTNRKEPDIMVLDWDIQFHIYAYAFEFLYKKRPTFMVWRHLRTLRDISVQVYGTPAKENHLFNMITYYFNTKNIVVRNTGFECMFCSFREQCLRS